MAKNSTAKTILIVGGVGLGVYLLTNSNIRQQLEDAIAKLTANFPGGGGGGIGDITLPGFDLPSFTMPGFDLSNLLGGLDTSAGLGGVGDLLGDLGDLFKPQPPGASNQPTEHATLLDVVYSMPSWAKGTIGVSAGLLGGYGGYQAIRVTAPLLRVLGTQSARAVGGAGNILANLLRSSAAKTVMPGATKLIPVAASRATTGGLMAGFLPGLALTGILEGAYQIFRTVSGAGQVGMTGVPPLDIINLIRGVFKLGPSAKPAPGLFDAIFGALFGGKVGAAEPAPGGTPGTVAPMGGGGYYGGGGPTSGIARDYSWCEAYGSPAPAETSAGKPKTGLPILDDNGGGGGGGFVGIWSPKPPVNGGGGGGGSKPLMT
jgi:hypothetical protein